LAIGQTLGHLDVTAERLAKIGWKKLSIVARHVDDNAAAGKVKRQEAEKAANGRRPSGAGRSGLPEFTSYSFSSERYETRPPFSASPSWVSAS
jgi:hypothetical protein